MGLDSLLEHMISIFALTTRGLEEICAQELASTPGVRISEIAYRKILAEFSGEFKHLHSIRTADDIFYKLDSWNDLAPQRAGLHALKAKSAAFNLSQAIRLLRQVRDVPTIPTFSVSASFVGKRNYNTDEIKQAVADGITTRFVWRYSPDDRISDLNIRIFIEHTDVLVGIRIGKASLQNRPYKQHHVGGSLKPPVAAAMIKLAAPDQRARVLDPFCGAGTILIEASQMGYSVLGGDIDPMALRAARENMILAQKSISLLQWDTIRLPLADHSHSTVITNLPWGRQIDVGTELKTLYHHSLAEIERILKPSGQAVLLTNQPDFIKPGRLKIDTVIEISLFGQKPTIMRLTKENFST
jgi:23S rRNA G2445 N2-methylase RlmL